MLFKVVLNEQTKSTTTVKVTENWKRMILMTTNYKNIYRKSNVFTNLIYIQLLYLNPDV